MKYFNLIILFTSVCFNGIIFGQTLNIHAVSTARQMGGRDNGYTLDGQHMAVSKFKLLNSDNFSNTGIYKKKVDITCSYFSSGSLEEITSIEGIDIFFFGSFINNEPSFVPFTKAEVDSLYKWSIEGGKMIIAEQGHSDGIFQNISYKWKYGISLSNPSDIFPNAAGNKTKIFSGPFGRVSWAKQGGIAQGYFGHIPENSVVLATNFEGKPTLYVDCNTMDLICADTDAFTDLGGITASEEIKSDQDRFWVNVIAFMDSIGNRPDAQIGYNGAYLTTDEYSSYQWLYNWDTINGAVESSVFPQADGYYRVIVNDEIGCSDTSKAFLIGSEIGPLINCVDIAIFTNPTKNYSTATLEIPEIIDNYNIISIENNAPDTFQVGITEVTWTVTDSEGYSSNCIQKVFVKDNQPPVIICPEDITISNEERNDYYVLDIGEPHVRDNVYVYSVTNDAPDTFNVGLTIVTWTVSDSSGNEKQCIQSISIADFNAPEIECPDDITISVSYEDNSASIVLDTPSVYDNSNFVTIRNDADSIFYLGITYVTWIAEDASGNSASCEQIVYVKREDLSIPNIITPNFDGLNDCFFIDLLPENSELVVFSSKNEILYKSSNYMNDWSGVDMHSQPIENGTYWFILKPPGDKQYSGFIIIKRQ
ncbi:MAG: HYR domain-containing protein [Bacteroidales bacterium]|nr:HYR domain-containing protein [Bacteroidales bacterium]